MSYKPSLGYTLASWTATAVLSCAVLAVGAYTLLCLVGIAPWLQLPVTFGETTYEYGGMVVQIALTALLLCLLAYLPGVSRVLQLEQSHRSFSLTLEDIARAFDACHSAERKGVFTLDREHDAVMERFAYLKAHPELDGIADDLLEIVAKMSFESKKYGKKYSDKKVKKLRKALRKMDQELDRKEYQNQQMTTWVPQLEAELNRLSKRQTSTVKQYDELMQRITALWEKVQRKREEAPENVVPMGHRTPGE